MNIIQPLSQASSLTKKRKLEETNLSNEEKEQSEEPKIKKRRKNSDVLSNKESEEDSDISTDYDSDNYFFDKSKKQPSPNVIRGKIRKLLASGEVKVTHFLKDINVNSNSYQRFMKLKGTWNGTQNSTYWGALRYFRKQEKSKKKMSKSEKETLKKTNKTKKKQNEKKVDEILKKIKSVEEKYDDTRVFDDCDDVRKKIKTFLSQGLMSQAQFLRIIGGNEQVQHSQYSRFMGMAKKGVPLSGAANKVFRLGYHFFEKLRIADGKEKSKKRLDNESWYPEGIPLEHDNGMRWVFMG